MARIKICGIRSLQDVEYINRYKPEYAGLVFAESRRKVTVEQADDLCRLISPEISCVGVFVNETILNVAAAVEKCGLKAAQLHGDEDPCYLAKLRSEFEAFGLGKTEVWKALRVKNDGSLSRIDEYEADRLLLDAFSEGSYGGAGKTFQWELAVKARKSGGIILAGGLNLQNVEDAIRKVQPFAVDVSSGVETDGCKDGSKIRDFIHQVRKC